MSSIHATPFLLLPHSIPPLNTTQHKHNTTQKVYLEVACLPSDVRPSSSDSEFPTTHLECDPTNMLSLIASLTPFSDYNQGPRIMYQCQMGKQTMGTPAHSIDQVLVLELVK